MSGAAGFNPLAWGNPTCGGPLTLQLAANASDATLIEEGLKSLLSPHRGLFLGPMMIGFITDMVLCGVMFKQLVTWSSFAIEDRMLIKVIVGWCALFGAIGSVFNLAFVHQEFVYHFGEYTELANSAWSSWLGVIAPLTSSGVQIFYCDRAYRLAGKNKLLALVILAFIFTSLIGGIGSKITSTSLADASAATKATIFIYLYTGGAMAADFTITVSIMWSLSHSKSGFVQTDQIVDKLLMLSAETQLPPTLMAIAFLIIFAYKTTKAAAHPDQFIIDVTSNLTGFFMMVMPKTYVVGFMAVLNSRTHLRAVMSSSQGDPSQQWKNNAYQLSTRSNHGAEGGIVPIQVTTETYIQSDRYDPKDNVLSQHEFVPHTVITREGGKVRNAHVHGTQPMRPRVRSEMQSNLDLESDVDVDFDEDGHDKYAEDKDDSDAEFETARKQKSGRNLTWADALTA